TSRSTTLKWLRRICATLASASPSRMTISNSTRIELPAPPTSFGSRSAPSRALRMRSISGNGRARSRSRSLAPSATRLRSASRSGERRSRGCERSRECADIGLFMCLTRIELEEFFLEGRKMLSDLDRLWQNLACDQPVRRFLQVGYELPVIHCEVSVLTLQGDELVTHLVAVLAGLLRDVLGVLAVFGNPFSFGAEGVVDGADQRGIVGRELAG